jgi:hypothetical protein
MPQAFLGFDYRVAEEGSSTRVYVWRTLKDMGALILHQGFALIPARDGIAARLDGLKAELAKAGGSSHLMEIRFAHPQEEEAIIAEFRRLRDEDYEEIAENGRRMLYELEREAEKGKFSLPELEEGEDELAKFKRWIAKVEARDFFQAGGRKAALEALAKAEAQLRSYSLEVYRKEGI